MRKQQIVLSSVLALTALGAQAATRDYISIVGSSTVYPFATVVAETFGKTTEFKTPKIESTGSGGGLKLFCAGVGVQTPDISNASRRIKKSELARCAGNGVDAIVEVKIGYDGIVLANSRQAPEMNLSRRDLFLALARRVPDPKGGARLVDNPYQRWNQVDPRLPDSRIEVLGPPPTSGTRDAFVELAMEGGCKTFDWIRQIKVDSRQAKKAGDKARADRLKGRYREICHTIREDGAYIEAGENDNLIVQKLEANPRAVGIFGYSFLEQNEDRIQGSRVDGVAPTFNNIAEGRYPVSRPLFFYVKKAHVGKIPGMREYIAEFTSEKAWGDEGYLLDKGLIPMPKAERAKYAAAARQLKVMQLD